MNPGKLALEFDLLETLLVGYEDFEVVEWLRYGRPLHLPNPIISIQNHKGATNFPDFIDKYIKEELQEGSMFGPFLCLPFAKRVQINPLTSWRKKSNTFKRRAILDLSRPRNGGSVNDGIPKIYIWETPGNSLIHPLMC